MIYPLDLNGSRNESLYYENYEIVHAFIKCAIVYPIALICQMNSNNVIHQSKVARPMAMGQLKRLHLD